MAQQYLSFLFLLSNILLSQAAFLHAPSILNELKQIESHEFGRKLLDTIALQMSNKAPLQDVAKLLAELRTGLENDQIRERAEHEERERICAETIKAYEDRIAHANQEIQEAIEQIGIENAQIKHYEGTTANARSQIAILEKRALDLEESYEADTKAYEARKVDHEQVLEALDIIIPKLEGIHPGETPGEEVMAQLAKIGRSNPIAALVSIASSLDPAALQNVINKLKDIKNSLVASLENDKNHQEEVVRNYNALKKEIQDVLEAQRKRLKEDTEFLNQHRANLAAQTERRKSNEDELDIATKGKQEKELSCQRDREKFEAETIQRTKEIEIIAKVENIIATRLEGMKDYLKERVNQ